MKHARSAAALAFLPAPQVLPAEGDHWGHEGATGPDAWATLDPASETCAEGTHQSPIDLSGAVHGDMGTIASIWTVDTDRAAINNSHRIQAAPAHGGSAGPIEIAGKT